MQRRVLVYGGRGALGSKIVEIFKNEKWVRIYVIKTELISLLI